MTRRELREHIFKLLFRVEFNTLEEMPMQCRYFFESEDTHVKVSDEEYIQDKYEKIVEKLTEIDALIDEKAEGWKTIRMGKVDLTILRLAVYEILFDDQVPTGVAINEAVELAKAFGQEESPGFINGVLAKFAN